MSTLCMTTQVDLDYNYTTDELSGLFEELDLFSFINNLNDRD